MKKKTNILLIGIMIVLLSLSGCTKENDEAKEQDSHLTVYLWESPLVKTIAPYIKEKMPDKEIEFIVGNNNVDLYNYLQEHGDLPDIITTRCFSANDAKSLQPYLLDFSSYDVVSKYYPYVLQYYKTTDGEIQWLPVCGIPETIIVNKTLFDKYGIELPKNYTEFAKACKKLKKNGINPYVLELSADWAAHSLVQGAAIDQFASFNGIEWRNAAESTNGEITFDDKFWNQIFTEVQSFAKDTYLDEANLDYDITKAKEQFINGKAAMFRGTPDVMEALQSNMDAKLARIPYFSQTSDESWIYTYPSFNVSFNKDLAEDEEKLDTAMKVLDIFISEEGQQLIANGSGLISYNADVDSDLKNMVGIKDAIDKNALYIRYASNHSFSASLKSVQGLLSGKMDVEQAVEEFKKELNSKEEKEEKMTTLKNQYALSLNDKNGRDVASSILTTVREEEGVEVALSDYYYYTSTIYKGDYTKTQLDKLIVHNDDPQLYVAKLTGSEIKNLVKKCLAYSKTGFSITSKYELPIASGMKLIVKQEDKGFSLVDIEVKGKSIEDTKEYKILFTKGIYTNFSELKFSEKAKELETFLSVEWMKAMETGNQPKEPEDYIKVEK